jgi:type IV secretion system protein VirB4
VQLQPLARIDDPPSAPGPRNGSRRSSSEGVAVDPQAKEHIWSALTSLASAPRRNAP